MLLQTVVAILLASSLRLAVCSAFSRLPRQTDCDPDNGAAIVELVSGLSQECEEAATQNTMHEVYCQQDCSAALVSAYEEACPTDCDYRNSAARRCYRLNETYSCDQLKEDQFTTISIAQLRATGNCNSQEASAECRSALNDLITIMGCCFNVIYNTTLYEEGGLELATSQLWELYDLPTIVNCLAPSFTLNGCSSSTGEVTTTRSSEVGLNQQASMIILMGAVLLAYNHQ